MTQWSFLFPRCFQFLLPFSVKKQKLKKVTKALLSRKPGNVPLGPHPHAQRQPRACWERPWTHRLWAFLSRQTESVARGRRSWMLARNASGDTASEPPRPGRKGARGTVGPVASWAGSVSKVFPAVDVPTFRPFRPGSQEQGPAARKASGECPEAPEIS